MSLLLLASGLSQQPKISPQLFIDLPQLCKANARYCNKAEPLLIVFGSYSYRKGKEISNLAILPFCLVSSSCLQLVYRCKGRILHICPDTEPTFLAGAACKNRSSGNELSKLAHVVPCMLVSALENICRQPILRALAADVLSTRERKEPQSNADGTYSLPCLA